MRWTQNISHGAWLIFKDLPVFDACQIDLFTTLSKRDVWRRQGALRNCFVS